MDVPHHSARMKTGACFYSQRVAVVAAFALAARTSPHGHNLTMRCVLTQAVEQLAQRSENVRLRAVAGTLQKGFRRVLTTALPFIARSTSRHGRVSISTGLPTMASDP